MQRAKSAFLSILRQIFMICLVIGILGVAVIGWAASPTQYIYEKTGFLSCWFPKQIYAFDAIGHGHDYDALHVYQLSKLDGKRFHFFLEDKENWETLPVDQNAENSILCDVEFDRNMNDMMSAKDGYWMLSLEHKMFCVYDESCRLLYIRTASSFTGHKWNE